MKNIFTKFLTMILISVLLISGYKLEMKLNEYRIQDSRKGEVLKVAKSDDRIDFDALKKINEDVLAWIYLKDTQIDYPVVQGDDNDEYIHKAFDGSWLYDGCLFVDAAVEEPFRDFNTIIYGHHMRSGAMFANLGRYKDEEFFRDHPVITLIREDGTYELHVAAILNERSDSDLYTTFFPTYESREEYIDLINSEAYRRSDVELSPDDTLVTLSTCAYEFKEARYLVVCRMEKAEQEYAEVFVKKEPSHIWLLAQIAIGLIMALIVIDTLRRTVTGRKKEK